MYTVIADLKEINIKPKTEEEEVLQNVKTILATVKGTVPLDREFGVDGKVMDLPISVVQAKITAAIVKAINRFEPRARVKKVTYNSGVGVPESATRRERQVKVGEYATDIKGALDGVLKPRVDIEIVEEEMRGYVTIEE